MIRRSASAVWSAVGAALLSLLLPGAVLLRRRPRFAVTLMTCAAVVLVWAWPAGSDWRLAFVDPEMLQVLVFAGAAWVLVGVVAAVVALHGRLVAQVLAAGLMLLPVVAVGWVLVPQWQMSGSVFVDAPVAEPFAEGVTTTVVRDDSMLRDGERFNVLLLGGDAGPGRWGLRTDAMHLVSIDARGEEIVVVSVPRNLSRAPMPRALESTFPNGFTNIANAVFGWGEANAEEVRAAIGATDEPGASLVAAMVAELTGVRVDGWVLTDMAGFIEVIDAVGGVRIWVDRELQVPGSVPSGKHPVANFSPGWHAMDGTDALAFSRARKQDSDYHRMARQRCVLASLAAQTDPRALLMRWPSIAEAVGANVRTNLSPAEVVWLRSFAGVDVSGVRVLSLDPEVISRRWELEDVRALVRRALQPTAVGATTASTLPVWDAPETPTTVVVEPESIESDDRWVCRPEP